MATKYSEAILAVKYREVGANGMKGGPMYYLRDGAKLPKLGMAFAIFTALAAFGIGNMAQSNAVATLLNSQLNIPTWVSGVVMLTLTAVVILGGIKSIGKYTSRLVPVMIVAYVVCAVVILVMNADKIGGAFGLIFYHAFNPIAAGGGFAGATIAAAIRFVVLLVVFSLMNQVLAQLQLPQLPQKTNIPAKQALVSMTQTFIDTLVVCTMTALIILISPFWQEGGSAGLLTMKSFSYHLGDIGWICYYYSNCSFCIFHNSGLELLW